MRALLSTLALAALLAGPTARAEEVFVRHSDKQVKSIVDKIGKDQQKFRRALSGDFKSSVVRGAEGELKVEDFLKDFDTATERVADRFTGKYSASSEVQQLLQLGAKMHAVVRANPAMKGANEWDVLANDLNSLALCYGAKFPPEPGAAIRRIGDAELADALAAIGKATDGVKNELKKAMKSSPDLAAKGTQALTDLDALKTTTGALKSRIASGNPATAEARQVATLGQSIASALAGSPPPLEAAWNQVSLPFAKVLQAFGFEP